MGNVSGRPEEPSPLCLTDQNRFQIAAVTVTNARGQLLLRLSPNAYPATRYTVTRDLGDDSPVEYIHDPESPPTSPTPSFLLRLTDVDELIFNFTFTLRQTPISNGVPVVPPTSPPVADTNIAGLTYIFASTPREVANLVVREFHSDPNLHKNPNVHLIGDYTTGGVPSVQSTWSWKWRPPKQSEDRGGGWRNTCSFVEYNQRHHRLDTLASFSFWVQRAPRSAYMAPPKSPRLEFPMPSARLRVPSTQSIESRVSNVSDSEGEGSYKDFKEPQSPGFDPIPENGLGLVPTMTGVSTINSAAAPGPFKVDVATCKPGEDPSLNDDGPLFRATMRSLEQKTGHMRLRMKKVLRTAEAAESAQHACNQAVADFTQALKEASSSNANAVQPALEHYFERIAREILQYERQNTIHLQKLIIDPISKLYNFEIKQADFKKREFDEESKEYYAYVGKYLGQRSESLKEKKQKQSDEKYQVKRRTFELKRFDYSSFMHDLHGGRKDQEVLSQLTKYADAQTKSFLETAKKVEEMVPQLDALVAEVKSADQDFQLQRKEREEKRRWLETSSKSLIDDGNVGPPIIASSGSVRDSLRPGDVDQVRSSSIASSAAMSTSPPIGSVVVGSPPNSMLSPTLTAAVPNAVSPHSKFKGIRDLEENGSTLPNGGAHRKEGLLWALSRPGSHVDPKGITKPGWHKFWIVLDQGKLSEYVNWKDKLDLHMDPIDLRMASVREARNSDRRFCFEVITPHFMRVYQAPSEDDMRSWIAAINNALQSAFESKNAAVPSTPSPAPTSHRKDIAAVLTGKSSSFSGHRQTSNPNRNEASKAVSRHSTTGDRPAHQRHVSDYESSALLQRVRSIDEGNQVCADCGSDSKVDWCSINLGVLLCIECSGIHRSLGTHISKVRSLTLDTAAFTPDIVEILLLIGNRVSNMVWEAKLDRFLKPSPVSTREQRLHFITAKYGDRMYVQNPTGAQTPDDHLLTSIKRNDIQNVLHALAQRANPNAHDRSRSTHAVYLALAAADPASPAGALHQSYSSPHPSIRLTSGSASSAIGSSFSSSTASTSTLTTNSASAPPSPARKPFPVAELLLQNGAQVPPEPSPFPLSESAQMYLEFKQDQRLGRPSAVGGSVGAASYDPSRPSRHRASAGPHLGSSFDPSAGIGLPSIPQSGPNSIPSSPALNASSSERTAERPRERLLKRNSGSRPRSRASLAAEAVESLVKK